MRHYLKLFYKKTHPDLMQDTLHKQVNTRMMQELNSFFDKPQNTKLQFYYQNRLWTAVLDADKHQHQQQLKRLFESVGVEVKEVFEKPATRKRFGQLFKEQLKPAASPSKQLVFYHHSLTKEQQEEAKMRLSTVRWPKHLPLMVHDAYRESDLFVVPFNLEPSEFARYIRQHQSRIQQAFEARLHS
ncbi:hypothetical protein EDD86DRAFT_201893 [Gorgonomyces haynaldii]|nr:hypothetical protein EDD86DRAFT_201893 [Gorgonomyces haynaldii]